MSEKWMDVFFEAQSEEQILTCFFVLSGFHGTLIVIIAVIAVIVLFIVIGAFLKNRMTSKSQISSLFISCLSSNSLTLIDSLLMCIQSKPYKTKHPVFIPLKMCSSFSKANILLTYSESKTLLLYS